MYNKWLTKTKFFLFFQSGPDDIEIDTFSSSLKSQVEIFVNRMKSNSSRGRSNANDSAVQTLFLNVTSMHSKLLAYIKEMDDKRMWFEQLQDKLTQVKDSRAALDMLRHEHQEKLRRIAEETERQRQMQMAHTLELMRKKKQEYLLYQRQLALRQIQEQEREMQMRQEQQKALYQMGGNFNYMPGMGQTQGSPIHMMTGANYGYVPMGSNPIGPGVTGGRIPTGQAGPLPAMHQPAMGMNQMPHGPMQPQLASLPPQGVLPQGQMNSRFQNTGQPGNNFPPNANQPQGLAMHNQQQPQVHGGMTMANDMQQSQQGQFPGNVQGNVPPSSQMAGIPSNNPSQMAPAQNMQAGLNPHMQPVLQQQQQGQPMQQQQQQVQPMQQQQVQPIQQQQVQPMQQQQQQGQPMPPIPQGQQLTQPQQQQQQNFAPQQQAATQPNNQPVNNNVQPNKPAEAELISFD